MGKIALLFLGGEVNERDISQIGKYDFVCCADSGLDAAIGHNVFPDLVIGDMDSISDYGLEYITKNNIEIVKHEIEKDFTDGELAITNLIGHHLDFSEIKVLGLIGGRPDHIYGNFLLLNRFEEKKKIIAYSDGFKIQVLDEGKYWFSSKPGSVVSIFALRRPARVRLIGLKYPFDGLINPLTCRAISNVSSGSFSIETNSDILVFIQNQV